MKKRGICIYGASGSGTTTLGKYIGEQLGYRVMDTDDYYWMPTNPMYTTKREPAERVRLMKSNLEQTNQVVVSGSFSGWGDELIPYFSLAVRIITETEERLRRLRERERRKFGERIDPGGDMYVNHMEFLAWAARYDTGGTGMRSKAKHDEWQKKLSCRQLTLNGADSLEKNLEIIQKALNELNLE